MFFVVLAKNARPLQRMISCRGVSARYALLPSVAQQIKSMLSVVLPPSVAQQLIFFHVVLAYYALTSLWRSE